MCLIIYRPAGVKLKDDILLAAGRINDDGLGVMWCKDGKIHTRRSMDVTQVFKFLHEAGDDQTLAIHFRFATHGTKDLSNCHPFRVTDDLYMMHNGVLPLSDKQQKLSDTAVYARRILRPVVEANPGVATQPEFRALVDLSAGSSNKLLFLRNDGASGEYFWANESLGTWFEGAWYSSGVPGRGYTTYPRTTYSGRYSNGYSGGSEYYDEEGWENYKSGKETTATSSRFTPVNRGSEDTAPLGTSRASASGSDSSASSASSGTTHSDDRAGYVDAEDLADRLVDARKLVDEFAGTLLVDDGELHEYLMATYGYDMDKDMIVAMGAQSIG